MKIAQHVKYLTGLLKMPKPSLTNSIAFISVVIVFSVALIYSSSAKNEITNYTKSIINHINKELMESGFVLSHGEMRTHHGIFKHSVSIPNLLIEKQDSEYSIKVPSLKISCNIISCALNKLTITPSIAIEYKIGKKHLLQSFHRPLHLVIKDAKNKTYLYYNSKGHDIFDMKTMKKISSIDSLKFVVDIVKIGQTTKIHLAFDGKSKDLFNLDYHIGNSKAIFMDTGPIEVSGKTNLEVSKISESGIPDSFSLAIDKLHLKTSEFTIKIHGNLTTKDHWQKIVPVFNLEISNFPEFVDYLGTLALNISNDVHLHTVAKKVILDLDNKMEKITNKKNNQNIKIHVTAKNDNELYLNEVPLKLVIFDLIA